MFLCLVSRMQVKITTTRDRQFTYKGNIKSHSCNHCCSGKTTSIAYSGCVCFSALSHKRDNFRKTKVIDYKLYVSISSTNLSETLLILRRTERHVIKKVIGFHVKYLSILSDFNESWIFSTDFRKILKHQLL